MAQTFGSERVPKNSPWFEKIDVSHFINYGSTLDAALQIDLLQRLEVVPNPQMRAILDIYDNQANIIADLYTEFFHNLLTCFMLSLRASDIRANEQNAVLQIAQDELQITPADIFTESEDRALADAVEVELAALFMLDNPFAEKISIEEQSYDDIPESERTYSLGHIDTLTEKWIQYQLLRFALNHLNTKIRVSYSGLQPGKSLTASHQTLHHALSVWNYNQTPEHIYTLLKTQFDRIGGFIASPTKNRTRYKINEMLYAGHFFAAIIQSFKKIEKLQNLELLKKRVDHKARFSVNQSNAPQSGPDLPN